MRNTSNWNVSSLQHSDLERVDRIHLCSLGLAQCRGRADAKVGLRIRAVNSPADYLRVPKHHTANLLPLPEPSSVKLDGWVPRWARSIRGKRCVGGIRKKKQAD